MRKNIGGLDKLIRVIAGVVLLYFAFDAGYWWGWIGLIPLLTAAFGFCPLYRIIRISTVGKNEGKGGCCCGGC